MFVASIVDEIFEKLLKANRQCFVCKTRWADRCAYIHAKDGMIACRNCAHATGRERASINLSISDQYKTHALNAILSRKACADCGLYVDSSNSTYFQWDHRNPGMKNETVYTLLLKGADFETIDKEIALCDLRCRVCHFRRTAWQRTLSSEHSEAITCNPHKKCRVK